MRNAIRVLTFFVASLVLLVGVVGLIGLALPRHHHAASRAAYRAPRDSVWAALSDMEHSPAWRSDVTGVRRLADRDGRPVWEQQTKEGPWALELTVIEPPSRLVATVADTTQGFGGTWTYTLADSNDGTVVMLSEDGFVDHPLFRFLARFVFGLHGAQMQYLRDLGRRFGEKVTPRQA